MTSSPPPRPGELLDPLKAILTTANDLFSTLENILGPAVVEIVPEPLEPLALQLPLPPDPAPSLRALGLSEPIVNEICGHYDNRVAQIHETTLSAYESAETCLSSSTTQIRLATIFTKSFDRIVKDLHEQAIDAALDILSIISAKQKSRRSSPQTSGTPSSSTSTSRVASQQKPSSPDSSIISGTSRNSSSSQRTTPTVPSSTSGSPSPHSSDSDSRPTFDPSVVPLFEYIFTNENNHYPSVQEKKELQERTGLSYRQVAVWFQNRRAREKKKIREGRAAQPVNVEEAVEQVENNMEMEIATQLPPQRQRLHLIQVLIRKEARPIFEPEYEDEGLCARDEFEEELWHRHLSGELPGLFDAEIPAGSYPEIFYEPPIYDEPYFAPIPAAWWPREPSKPTAASFTCAPVDELDDVIQKMEALEIQRYKTVTVKRRHHVVITLPDDPEIAGQLRERVQSIATMQHIEGGMEMWHANKIMTEGEDLASILQLQIQIDPQEQDAADVQIDAEEPPISQVDYEDAVMPEAAVPTELEEEDGDHSLLCNCCEPATVHCDDESDSSVPSLAASTSTLSWASLDNLDQLVDLEEVACQLYDIHPAAVDNPVINAIPDPLTLEEQMPKDPAVLNYIVKLTLDEHGIPYPSNIDDPFVASVYPNFALSPAEPLLDRLKDVYAHYEKQWPLPSNATHITIPHPSFLDPMSRDFPTDPIMDLIPDQDILDPEPEHTLLSDLQVAFPSIIFDVAEAPVGWNPEPPSEKPDGTPFEPLPPLHPFHEELPYIVGREQYPSQPWAIDEFIDQHPLLQTAFGYPDPGWNESGWLDHIVDQDRHVMELTTQMPPPEPRKHRRQNKSTKKPAEPAPPPKAIPVREPEPVFGYISLPLPEPAPLPTPDPNPSPTGWMSNICNLMNTMVNQAFDWSAEEFSMLQYLNF